MLIKMREERGMAMVVALLVSFVVLMLSTVVVAQSIHALNGSGYDRQRLLSVNAAEAGVDYWWEYVQNTALTSFSPCNTSTGTLTKTGTLSSGPSAATYSATATFYSSDGSTKLSCPFTDSNPPTYMRVLSTGAVAGASSRDMESFGRLTAIRGGFGGAVISNLGTSFGNNFQINGQSGNDGDVYILNGNLSISNSPVIYGSVYVPNGTLTMTNTAQIKGNAWANGTISMVATNSIQGWAKSTTGNITGGSVGGDATAGGSSITSTVAGTKYPNTNPGAVPTQSFPQITSSTTPWTSAGYTLCDATCYGSMAGTDNCAKAYNWINSTTSGWSTSGYTNVVIRIATTCTFQNNNNDTNTVRGNLAILSDGSFNLRLLNNWNGTSSSVKKMFFVSVYTGAACSGTTKNITVSNNTNFNSYTNVFFYTPCTATMGNTNAFSGQVIAGTVNISNLYSQSYVPVQVPGYGSVTGFQQDVAYKRETN